MKKIAVILILVTFGLSGCYLLKNTIGREQTITEKTKKGGKKLGATKELAMGDGDPLSDRMTASAPLPRGSNPVSRMEPDMVQPQENVELVRSTREILKTKTSVSTGSIGEILYKVPDTMVVFHEYTITVRISRKIGTTEIMENLDGKVTKKTITTSERMDVILVDSSPDSSFSIKNINTSGQIIDSVDYTEWKFGAKPLKPGRKTLNLVVSIISESGIKQKVYSDDIQVKANIGGEVKSWWGKYWQWMFTTIIIPLVIYFWKRKKKED